ncbi:MAG: hypothetical protein A3G32_07505 [Deltaproteobacteria bacterium RIFCSPLOWO2_12_FULL_40_28]|nr:MAG: hypothetical protein A3C45_08180 [Deltaproteobacteria bacterium RIFCSPHIGHO2_02_FULL_40_28]OGQ20327.1 MAG: hypothetical protein A3E27_00045 [Deltaproteobacteria bacterium RIFCSPHIGHO2_12_FULL_40_32]OGQ40784.1 MAG: hypothetical protein A3I69_06725 [Deltaproteobacteria bacterium RIFCSPLOWO2_02_FULL_40_36]OGQ54934.1 MAG: hypothetical protein A3G32_07505 [Deltaproteobacteria bacterium RIFCSPLOWO2_12_FULL_40_28]
MNLSIIVAMTQNGVIGVHNQLPWHLTEDLKRFKQMTMGHPLIMGRKTHESIGKPLTGRTNIVLTRDPHYKANGIIVAQNLAEAMRYASADGEAFVIGGADIYKQAYPLAKTLYVTLILDRFEGDVFFPEVNFEKDFKIVEESKEIISEKEKIRFKYLKATR